MIDKVTIRPAKSSDVSIIYKLGEHVDEFATGNATVNFWPQAILEKSINSKEVIILVAENGGALAGFVIANCNKVLSKALVENIYVKSEMRGKGIGGKLLEALKAEAQQRECEYITTLIPTDDTSAAKMYEKAGFIGSRDAFLWLDFSNSKVFRK